MPNVLMAHQVLYTSTRELKKISSSSILWAEPIAWALVPNKYSKAAINAAKQAMDPANILLIPMKVKGFFQQTHLRASLLHGLR